MTGKPTPAKPDRPTRQQLLDAYGCKISDVIAPGLDVLFSGINPSLYSAAVDQHFARPGNRFWTTLYNAGFTTELLTPDRQRELLARRCGLTNLVARATARADELSPLELRRGRRSLTQKVAYWKPRCVAFLGVTAFRAAFELPKATMGRQTLTLADASVWVLPNPSGLNAHYQLPNLQALFAQLRNSIDFQG